MAKKKKSELRDQTITEFETIETDKVPGPCIKCKGNKFMTEIKDKRFRVHCLSCPTIYVMDLPGAEDAREEIEKPVQQALTEENPDEPTEECSDDFHQPAESVPEPLPA